MKALLLGARGAVGTVVHRELTRAGHHVTRGGRRATDDAAVDLSGDLTRLHSLAADHDVVINTSGIERPEIADAVGSTPLVDISASGEYLDALRDRTSASGTTVLGAGLAPGLSTVLASDLPTMPGDDIDVFVMLGSGEEHGPAAVTWTAELVGSDVYGAPESAPVRNLIERRRAAGPDGGSRTYLRADFPDHVLIGGDVTVRSYLALSSAAMTAALGFVGRVPALRGLLANGPHIGSSEWHILVVNQRTGERRASSGVGQSEATGRLTALAATRAAGSDALGAVTMADLVTADEAVKALQ